MLRSRAFLSVTLADLIVGSAYQMGENAVYGPLKHPLPSQAPPSSDPGLELESDL